LLATIKLLTSRNLMEFFEQATTATLANGGGKL